jgi:hypothetical protein
MPEYKAFDEQVEVKGAAILATLQGIDSELVTPVAQKFGLVDVQAGQWYPQQAWLDTLKALDETQLGGTLNLVAVGMKIPDTADWPAEINSFEAALFSIDEAYHMNHRHGEIGHYQAERINDQQIDVICNNPYPCYFDYGIVYAVAHRFTPKGGYTVTHDERACRKRGDSACVYHVKWRAQG